MLDGDLGFCLGEDTVPVVHGVARLAGAFYAGSSLDDVRALIGPEPGCAKARAGWLMDQSWAHALAFSPEAAIRLQCQALIAQRVFRVRGGKAGLRLLALAAPGNLMMNAPLDFVAEPAGLQLDIAYLADDGRLPAILPDHDVAIVAASDGAQAALARLGRIFAAWPRPILNDPARILPMSRTWLPRQLASIPDLVTAEAMVASRTDLLHRAPPLPYPFLIRPPGSHAGYGLALVDTKASLRQALRETSAEAFTLTAFIDYRDGDGWYRKYRIAFVDRRPFICHMAASDHWMVHYLNAGMEGSDAKRAAEEAAMLGFGEFADRHAAALAGLADAIALDYFSVDCAQTPDGRLLVFEADTAAIIHSMDPPDLYPYKRPIMQHCYDAFGAMVRARATRAG